MLAEIANQQRSFERYQKGFIQIQKKTKQVILRNTKLLLSKNIFPKCLLCLLHLFWILSRVKNLQDLNSIFSDDVNDLEMPNYCSSVIPA